MGSARWWLINTTLLENSLLIAHSDGLVEIFDDSVYHPLHHVEGEEVLLAALFSQDLPDLPSTIFSMDYLEVDGEDWIAVSHLLGKEVYRYSNSQWIETDLDGDWLHYDGQVMVGSNNGGWQTSSGEQSPEYTAVRGGCWLIMEHCTNSTALLHLWGRLIRYVTIGCSHLILLKTWMMKL